MPLYQKAYQLKQLRRFAGWKETWPREEPKGAEKVARPGETESSDPDEPTDESIVYMGEDLTVSRSCFDATQKVFDRVTPEWEEFCRKDLGFAVPDWEEESRIVREKLAKMESGSHGEQGAPGPGAK